MELTQERVRELFYYDSETGIFTRKIRVQGSRKKVGEKVGRIHHSGYVELCIDMRQYRAHRIAWLYVHGELPPQVIDHINEVKTDNRICNLRPCTIAENNEFYWSKRRIQKAPIIPKTRPERKIKFRARIWVDGKDLHIGYFGTKELAKLACDMKRFELGMS